RAGPSVGSAKDTVRPGGTVADVRRDGVVTVPSGPSRVTVRRASALPGFWTTRTFRPPSGGVAGSTSHERADLVAPLCAAGSPFTPTSRSAATKPRSFVVVARVPAPARLVTSNVATDWGGTENPSTDDTSFWRFGPWATTVRPTRASAGFITVS